MAGKYFPFLRQPSKQKFRDKSHHSVFTSTYSNDLYIVMLVRLHNLLIIFLLCVIPNSSQIVWYESREIHFHVFSCIILVSKAWTTFTDISSVSNFCYSSVSTLINLSLFLYFYSQYETVLYLAFIALSVFCIYRYEQPLIWNKFIALKRHYTPHMRSVWRIFRKAITFFLIKPIPNQKKSNE